MAASKLSQNPFYGIPSARKQRARNEGWKTWANGMTLLHAIHAEEREKLASKAQADSMLDKVAWNTQ